MENIINNLKAPILLVLFGLLSFTMKAQPPACTFTPETNNTYIVAAGQVACVSASSGFFGSLLVRNGGHVIMCKALFTGSLTIDPGGTLWDEPGVTTYTGALAVAAGDRQTSAGNCDAVNGTCSSDGGTLSSAATVCSGANSGTLNLAGKDGDVVKWQEREFSGGSWGAWTDVANTTTSLSYTNLTNNTRYRVEVKKGSCTADFSNVIAITVSSPPTIASATPGDRCNTGTVDLEATASAGTLSWFAAATGGTALGSGSPWTTPSISATTTYYVEADNSGCKSAARTAVVATVNDGPTIDSNTPGDRCGSGTVSLAATASGGTINWYAASTGGASLGTGSPWTTPSISATTTYYVESNDGTCSSASRTAVAATVNDQPTIDTNTPGARCGTGVVSLAATASTGTINWYAAATGGASLGTGSPWNTPSISTTTTYYVETNDGTCSSASRTAVNAVISGQPTVTATTPGERCGTGTVSLSGTASAGDVKWYTAATGGASIGSGSPWTTPSISATTTYYVEAEVGTCISATRTAVVATVNDEPTVSATTPGERCGTGSVSLGATASTGDVNWFAAATGGAALGTGSPWSTPSISATTTYYVESNDGTCSSASRTAVVATVNDQPTIDTNTPGERCGTGTVSLSATASTGTISWYAASSGGAALGTGSPWVTPSISATTTYYVETNDGTCSSASRTAVLATVNDEPSVTIATPGDRCGTGTVSLAATASSGSINWYTAATGGVAVGTGSPWTTPSISSTTTYYAESNDGTCSSSSRVAVLATINDDPTVATTTPGSKCTAGSVNLGATSSSGTVNWYAASSGGAVLGSGSPWSTPVIAATTTYYVEAVDGSCASGSRLAVIATIGGAPTVVSTTPGDRCGTGTVTLGAAASSGTINWYAASSGGAVIGTGTSWTTPSISATTTYYAEVIDGACTSISRTAVAATINTVPSVLTTTPGDRCGAGTVSLEATGSGGTINWYAASSGGVSLGTGSPWTTPSISTTTTYYAETVIGSCSSASRTAVDATVNIEPTINTNTPGGRCGTGVVSLEATASGGTINWYAAATGGASLGTGSPWSTPSISATTTYYVESNDGTCGTPSRTAVIATVSSEPAVSTTIPGERCGAGVVNLAATAASGTINWYAAATGGASLGTGPSWTTPSITATTTYYVETNDGTCSSASRTAVVATVNTQPSVDTNTPGERCGPGQVSLEATTSAGDVNWYAAATGGVSLGTGSPWSTPSISATTTYYVEGNDGTCSSASRTAVVATVNTQPTVDTNTPGERCGAGVVTLEATTSAGTVTWFADAVGGVALGTGSPWSTPSISTTTTYYVEGDDAGCSSGTRTAVEAKINDQPTVSSTTPGERCGTGTVELSATSSTGTVNWYADPTGGAVLGIGTPWSTPSISVTTTFYIESNNGICSSASRIAVVAAVNDNPTVTFALGDADMCISETALTLSGGFPSPVAPATGEYSGTGVSGGRFDPAVAGVGTHTLTYTYTDENGCVGSSSGGTSNMLVNDLPDVTLQLRSRAACHNQDPFVLGGGSPSGGEYSGSGIVTTPTFTPAISGTGKFELTYTLTDGNGCTNSATDTLLVRDIPVTSFNLGSNDKVCVSENSMVLSGGNPDVVAPATGVYSGNEVSGGIFHPNAAGEGFHSITFTYTDIYGCVNTASDIIEVLELPEVRLLLRDSKSCPNEDSFNLIGGIPKGGVYSGPGISASPGFDPGISGVGIHTITYTITDDNGCENSVTDGMSVNELPTLTFDLGGNGSMCLNDDPSLLTGGAPTGGIYSGVGIENSPLFDPSVAKVGGHQITYTYTDFISGCTNTITDEVLVHDVPAVEFDMVDNDRCVNNSAAVVAGGLPLGGVYSGPGISSSPMFDPAVAGVGVHSLAYTFTDDNGCVNLASDDIEVFDLPEVSFSDQTKVCIDASIFDIVTGFPAGGEYSGVGIKTSPDFNPAEAGAGVHTITYTFTDDNHCTNTSAGTVTVNALPDVSLDNLPTTCINIDEYALVGGLPLGGDYTGVGVLVNKFDPERGGVGSHEVTYTYTDDNSCTSSAKKNLIVHGIPNVDLGSDREVCLFLDAVLTVPESGAVSYDWNTGEKTQTISTNQPGDYSVVVTDKNNCSDEGKLTLSQGANLQDVELGDDLNVCEGVPVIFSVPSYNSITWNDESTGTSVSIDKATTVHVLVVDDMGCFARDTAKTIFIPKGNVTALRTDTTICEKAGDVVVLEVSNQNVTGEWQDGFEGLRYEAIYGGEYVITIEDEFGCFASDTVVLKDSCSTIGLTMPNIFTPNSDGYNDFFIPIEMEWADPAFVSANVTYVKFQVFDRWGIMVYASDGMLPRWDGRSPGGSNCADGAYFWKLEYADGAGNEHNENGFVEIFRKKK